MRTLQLLLGAVLLASAQGPAPSINSGGAVNAASYAPGMPLAPGSIAAVYGSFLLGSPSQAGGLPLTTNLSGLSVQFGDVKAPLFYASSGQVNLQVPWELAGQKSSPLSATLDGQAGAAQMVQISGFSPGIFSMNSQGTGQGAIIDSSYRLVDPSNPATAGSTDILIYCTGLDLVTNQPPSGSPSPSSPLAQTTTAPIVTIGGVHATVLFSGLAPGFVGLYQVNAQVPTGTPTGNAVPVVISVGGATSNTVTMTVINRANNPVPAITSLSPSAVMVGAAARTLTLNGTNFVSSSTVTYNGTARTAAFVNSTQLTISLTAGDLSTAGNSPVVVTNPAPGGGLSNSVNLLVYSHFSAPTWQTLGPRAIPNSHACDNSAEGSLLAAGKIQAFAINRGQPNVMYAGGGVGPGDAGPASDAGVYKSTDGGTTWVQTSNGLADTFISALWLDQSNPSVLVASSWLDGIFLSTDGGSTWSTVYPAQTTSLVQVSGSLYAATANGVAVSADSGATWQLAASTTSPVRAFDGVSGVLYAGLGDGTIITQQGSGASWTTVLPPGSPGVSVWDVAVNASNSQQVILVRHDDSSGQLVNLITNNGGGSWTSWSAPAAGGLCGSGGPAVVVGFDSVNPQIIYAGSGGELYVSLDGASSWTGQHLFEDIKLIQPIAGQSGVVVVGGDQGIYMSRDAGITWSSLNGNLTTNLLNMVAVNGSEIFATIQDFSPVQTFDGGRTWLQLSASNPPVGENGVVAINPGNPNYQYVFNGVGFQYSTDAGKTFTVNTSFRANEWTFSGPANRIAIDPTNPSTVYVAGNDGVFQSLDWGVTWKLLSWPFKNPSLVVVGPDGTIFVGTPQVGATSGTLNASRDGGATWAISHLPASTYQTPNALSVNPANAEIAVLGMSGPPNVPGGGVLISTDSGASFAPDNSGLAARSTTNPAPFYTFSVQFASASYPDVVAVATFDGIYVSQAGDAWTDISGNAVSRFFQGIAWDAGNLYVSTYGEGVLRTPVTQILIP